MSPQTNASNHSWLTPEFQPSSSEFPSEFPSDAFGRENASLKRKAASSYPAFHLKKSAPIPMTFKEKHDSNYELPIGPLSFIGSRSEVMQMKKEIHDPSM